MGVVRDEVEQDPGHEQRVTEQKARERVAPQRVDEWVFVVSVAKCAELKEKKDISALRSAFVVWVV